MVLSATKRYGPRNGVRDIVVRFMAHLPKYSEHEAIVPYYRIFVYAELSKRMRSHSSNINRPIFL